MDLKEPKKLLAKEDGFFCPHCGAPFECYDMTAKIDFVKAEQYSEGHCRRCGQPVRLYLNMEDL